MYQTPKRINFEDTAVEMTNYCKRNWIKAQNRTHPTYPKIKIKKTKITEILYFDLINHFFLGST